MSAVLSSPVLPTLVSTENLKSFIQSEIQKGIDKTLQSKNYVSIEDYNELKAEVISLKAENAELKDSHIENAELQANAMKRITQLESGLFLKDSEGEIIRDDEDKPIISPKIESGIIEDAGKETFIPSGKYEKGAVELVKLAASMKPLDGKKAITCSMFHHFRNNILPEELKPTEKAARVWKQEIIKIVQRIAPDVWIDKKKDQRGNRLAFPKDFNINKLSVSLL